MALTLLDASRMAFNDGKEKLSEVMAQFALNSQILRDLPFRPVTGAAIEFPVEERLPGVGVRGYNEAFDEDTGEVVKQTEKIAMMGGDLDVDRAFIIQMGEGVRSEQENMKVRALSLYFDRLFIKGDPTTDSDEFAGLQYRLSGTGTQIIPTGNTSGGDALSLTHLDQAYYQVDNPTHWIFPKSLALKLSATVRNTSIAGYISFEQDGFGKPQMYYAGLPILMLDQDNLGNQILGYNEACPGGGTGGTSVYCISMGLTSLTGIQNTEMDVRDLGELQVKPVMRTRVDWMAGLAVFNPRSIARIWGIKNVAIVA